MKPCREAAAHDCREPRRVTDGVDEPRDALAERRFVQPCREAVAHNFRKTLRIADGIDEPRDALAERRFVEARLDAAGVDHALCNLVAHHVTQRGHRGRRTCIEFLPGQLADCDRLTNCVARRCGAPERSRCRYDLLIRVVRVDADFHVLACAARAYEVRNRAAPTTQPHDACGAGLDQPVRLENVTRLFTVVMQLVVLVDLIAERGVTAQVRIPLIHGGQHALHRDFPPLDGHHAGDPLDLGTAVHRHGVHVHTHTRWSDTDGHAAVSSLNQTHVVDQTHAKMDREPKQVQMAEVLAGFNQAQTTNGTPTQKRDQNPSLSAVPTIDVAVASPPATAVVPQAPDTPDDTASPKLADMYGKWSVSTEDGVLAGIALVTPGPPAQVIVWGVDKYTYNLQTEEGAWTLAGMEEKWQAEVSAGTSLRWTRTSSDNMCLLWTKCFAPCPCDTTPEAITTLLGNGRARGFDYRWALEECHLSQRVRDVSTGMAGEEPSRAIRVLTAENCVGIDRVTWDRKFSFVARHPRLNSYRAEIHLGGRSGVSVTGGWRNSELEAAHDAVWFLQYAVPTMIADPTALCKTATELGEVEVDVEVVEDDHPPPNPRKRRPCVEEQLQQGIAECEAMDPDRAAAEWFDTQYKAMQGGSRDMGSLWRLMQEAAGKAGDLMEQTRTKKAKLAEALDIVKTTRAALAEAQSSVASAESVAMAILRSE